MSTPHWQGCYAEMYGDARRLTVSSSDQPSGLEILRGIPHDLAVTLAHRMSPFYYIGTACSIIKSLQPSSTLLIKGAEGVLSLAFILGQVVQCLLALPKNGLLDLFVSRCKLDSERLGFPVGPTPINDQQPSIGLSISITYE